MQNRLMRHSRGMFQDAQKLRPRSLRASIGGNDRLTFSFIESIEPTSTEVLTYLLAY